MYHLIYNRSVIQQRTNISPHLDFVQLLSHIFFLRVLEISQVMLFLFYIANYLWKDLNNKEKSFIFTCIISISGVLYFFASVLIAIWYYFLSAWRVSFNISWSISLLVIDSLCISEKNLYFTCVWKDIFTGKRVLERQVLFFCSYFEDIAPLYF